MKRLLLLVIVIVIVLGLTGCGSVASQPYNEAQDSGGGTLRYKIDYDSGVVCYYLDRGMGNFHGFDCLSIGDTKLDR